MLSFVAGLGILFLLLPTNATLGLVVFFATLIIIPTFSYVSRVALVECNISTLFNGVLSTIFFILIEIKNVCMGMIPPLTDPTSILGNINALNAFGYTFPQIMNTALSAFLLPLFIMFSFGTIVALGKTYWIRKYNDGIDITYIEPPAHMKADKAPAAHITDYASGKLKRH